MDDINLAASSRILRKTNAFDSRQQPPQRQGERKANFYNEPNAEHVTRVRPGRILIMVFSFHFKDKSPKIK